MLKMFYTTEFDNRPFVRSGGKTYTVKEIKSLIAGRVEEFANSPDNLVIISGDNFGYIINFFAGIFADKNVYLVTEKQKLQYLNKEYFIPDNNFTNKTDNYKFPQKDTKNTLIYIYTSGSTGEPKEIKKSIYSLTVESIETSADMGIQTENLIIKTSTTPCHMFGLTYYIGLSFSKICAIDTDTVTFPEDIEEENCLFVTSPTFLKMFLKHITKSSIIPKYIISAGAKLNNDVFRALKNITDVTDIYGSSEFGAMAYRKECESDYLKLFNNVKITEDKKIITEYGYMTNTQSDDNLEIKGREIKILGRKDRLLKINDKRVSAELIETALKSTDFVKEACCFKHKDKLSAICALTEDGKKALIKEGIVSLTKRLKQTVKEVSEILPQKWRFIHELPHTTSGKLNKALIEHMFSVNISFPVILDKTLNGNEIIYKIFFHKNCNFYNGHFPDFPITPGVIQLYYAGELINIHFNQNCSTGQLKRIKFNNIIKPDSVINLKLEKIEKRIKYTYMSEDFSNVFSSGELPLYNIFKGEKTNVSV